MNYNISEASVTWRTRWWLVACILVSGALFCGLGEEGRVEIIGSQ